MGGGKRKTEKKAFSFGGSWSGGNVGGGGGNDNTSLNEGQDTVTNDTYSRVEQKENERSNDNNALQQAYLQTTKPVINTPAPVKPVVKPPEPKPEPKIQFMAPEPEPSKLGPNTGITISSNVPDATGGKESPSVKISTYKGGEKPKEERSLVSNVYEDPNTGSTIATKTARENIADGDFYNVVASTSGPPNTHPLEPVVKTGDILKSGPEYDSDVGDPMANPFAKEQQRILTNTYNPRPSEDLATGDPLQYSSSTSTTAINPRINNAVRRALISLGKSGGQLRRYFVR